MNEMISGASVLTRPLHNCSASPSAKGFIAASGKFNADGQPVQRFIKDLISLGVYIHPWNEWTMDVTPERLELWLGAFKIMQQNGVKVPITVDHSGMTEDTQGYVVDMYIEGDSLIGIHEFVGEQSIALATRVGQVSILVEKEFVDGKGRNYGEAIVHSSLVPDPVVPDQDEFVPIAASRGQKSLRATRYVYQLEKPYKAGANNEEPKMDINELLKQIRQALGAGEDLVVEGIAGRITERLEAGIASKTDLEKKIVELTGKVETLEATAASLTPNITKVDPDVIEDLAESAEVKIDGLVERGKITPAVAASLKDNLIGKAGHRNSYSLSRRVSGGDMALTRSICQALEQNDIIKLGEKTGAQVTLSRPNPDETPADFDQEVQNAMVAMADKGRTG